MGEEKKKKGGSLKIIIIVLLVLVVVGGGAFAGYYFLYAKNKADTTNQNANYNVNNQVANNQQVNNTNNVNTITGYEASAYTVQIDEFLVNLADEGGKKYLKTKFTIGYNTKESKKMAKEFEDKKAMIRDAINSVLRSKKSTDFTQKGVEDLKKEILTRINPIFEYGRANNIFFQDILVQ